MLLAARVAVKLIFPVPDEVGLITSVRTFSTGDDVMVAVGLAVLFVVERADNCLSTASSI